MTHTQHYCMLIPFWLPWLCVPLETVQAYCMYIRHQAASAHCRLQLTRHLGMCSPQATHIVQGLLERRHCSAVTVGVQPAGRQATVLHCCCCLKLWLRSRRQFSSFSNRYYNMQLFLSGSTRRMQHNRGRARSFDLGQLQRYVGRDSLPCLMPHNLPQTTLHHEWEPTQTISPRSVRKLERAYAYVVCGVSVDVSVRGSREARLPARVRRT